MMSLIIRLFFGFVFLVALAGAIAAASFYYYQYRTLSAQQASDETTTLVAHLSQFIELPTETPTLATVSDPSKLDDQPFFRSAQTGDKVLIFTGAKRAILYRPSTGKIIDIAPVQTADDNLSASPTPKISSAEEPFSLDIYNGTTVAGLANQVATDIKSSFPNVTVQETATALNSYDNTIVVLLNPEQEATASMVADFLKANVVSLPEGERRPEGDLLIIIGTDYTDRTTQDPEET